MSKDIDENDDMCLNCVTTVILQLQLSMESEKNQKLLEKVWVSVYDSRLTDEQVCRLAATHNLNNQGSKQTKWTDRVVACRQWLYKLANADIDRDDTPESSKEWKKACQSMYTTTGKVPLFKEILSPDIQVHFLKESSRHPISTSIISFH